MIIQCEQCSTKFRLDDSKVTDKGVKVRCAKCRHVFTVRKDQYETETQPDLDAMLNQPQPDFSAMLDQSAAFTPDEPTTPAGPEQETPASTTGPESGLDYSDFVSSDFADQGEGPQTERFEPLKDESVPASTPGDDFSFSALENEHGFEVEHNVPQTTASGDDFGGFDFAAEDADAGKTVVSAPPVFDFGEAPPSQDVADSADGAMKPQSEAEPKFEASFNLDDFDFGDETASQPAVQEAPPEPALARQALVEPPQAAGDELPPLSITSRRKQNSLLGVLIAVATVVAVTVLGYFGYTMFQEDKVKVAAEAGRITVRAVNASFMTNPAIGDLLVITGEAVNSFTKPRAAIQVRGMVYGANGQVLVSKNAYCGNPLTKAQLTTLPLDKIEAAMANQFGDSLANMEVAPGKAIPFVIVIPKPPAEARDYGVQPSGSTVATGKQQ